MKKLLALIIITLAIFSLCGCKKENKPTSNNKNTEIQEEITKPSRPTTEIPIKEKEEVKKEEPSKPIESPKPAPKPVVTDPKQETNEFSELPKEEIIIPPQTPTNKKIVICTINEEGSYYTGIVTHTTTFENDTIIHNKLYTEKHFNEGYKAEEDDWTISHIEALKNNTKAGITGTIDIKDNITYLTINYDVKTNPILIDYITTHTEYNDFLNHMTNTNGYTCSTN